MHHAFESLETAPLIGRASATRFRHRDNGLQVIISPRPGCGVAAVQLWYRVGSSHEDPSATGLAHFFEHMMFRGTRSNGTGEYDRILEELGCHGGTNAFTWKDFTAYVQEVPSDSVRRVLEMEADRMGDLDLTLDNVTDEAGAVLDEKRLSLSDSDSVRFDTLFEQMHKGQPGAWPVLGYEDHIRAYSPESCESFYRQWYAPNNACVVVSGDIEPDKLLAEVDDVFGGLNAAETVPTRGRSISSGRFHLQQDINLNRLDMNFGIACDETLPLVWELAARALAASEVGAFESALVEPGLTLAPSWWLGEAPAGEHLLHLSMTLMPGVNADQVEEIVHKVLGGCGSWLDDDMARIAQVDYACDFANTCSRLDERSTWLGEEWVYRRHLKDCENRSERLKDLGSRDLQVALQSLAKSNLFVLTAGPT